MTLCVAATVPCQEMASRGRTIRFVENGIVILADSRFGLSRNGLSLSRDDGLKVLPMNGRCIVGYSGVANVVGGALRRLADDAPIHSIGSERIAGQLSRYLLDEQKSWIGSKQHSTDLLLGLRHPSRRSFSLYRLSSTNDFQPVRQFGIIAIGSGASEFRRRFTERIDYQIEQIYERVCGAGPFAIMDGRIVYVRSLDDGTVPVRVFDVTAALSSIVLGQIAESVPESVGGAFQCYMLKADGYSPVAALGNADRDGPSTVLTRADLSMPHGFSGGALHLRYPLRVEDA